jgi:uncharacterized protein YjiS (DUF1127 family)
MRAATLTNRATVSGFSRRLPSLRSPLRTWIARARSRAALRKLDGRLLKDIGRTECERAIECNKWFWQS